MEKPYSVSLNVYMFRNKEERIHLFVIRHGFNVNQFILLKLPCLNKDYYYYYYYYYVRAAKLIYGMDWYTPSEEVLARAGWTTIGHMYLQDAVAGL